MKSGKVLKIASDVCRKQKITVRYMYFGVIAPHQMCQEDVKKYKNPGLKEFIVMIKKTKYVKEQIVDTTREYWEIPDGWYT